MMFIRSKVLPPVMPRDIVLRDRVTQLLQESIDEHRLTLVLATAGSGKTVAVMNATEGLGRPLVWLTVDGSDAVPGRLLTYLEAAVGTTNGRTSFVSEALQALIPPSEAAGLLAETLLPDTVMVIDNVERLDAAAEAWAVLASMVRYAGPSVSFVIVGRREVPTSVLKQPQPHSIGRVGPKQLAVSVEEATAILRKRGQSIDAVEARVRSVDGWIAGTLFGGDPLTGVDADERHGVLMAGIVDDIPEVARELLIRTAVLDEVDELRAAHVMGSEARAGIEILRDQHLPLSWVTDSFRLQPPLRDYVLTQFARLPLAEQRSIRRRHGDLLSSERSFEQAVHEYHQAGDIEAARSAAQRCILAVLERGDLDLAEDWLRLFGEVNVASDPTTFTVAELFIANARMEHDDAIRLADSIIDAGALTKFLGMYHRVGELLAQAYASGLRVDRYDQVIRESPASPGIQAVQYGMSLATPGKPAPRPSRSNGPLDVMIAQADWHLGRHHLIPMEPGGGIVDLLTGPFRIAVARVRGRTQEALDMYRRYSSSVGRMLLLTQIGPEVLLDAGLVDEALETVRRGWELAQRKNVGEAGISALIVEGKILLRGRRDPRAALAVLERRHHFPPFAEANEAIDLWRGLALLQLNEDDEAMRVLNSVVERMQANDHLLELSTAAIYLSEAKWRSGDLDAADAVADLALDAARKLGTNHPLLQALVEFPGVIARRLDAESLADTEWHSLTRPLSVEFGYGIVDSPDPQVHFRDFGSPTIDLLGERIQPRLTKTFEILAFLLEQPNHMATRRKLLETLFEGDTAAARTYLRQALKWVRTVLPEGGLLVQEDQVAIDSDVFIESASARFKQLTIESGRLRGEDQIKALMTALSILEQGEYLEGSHSPWILQRRTELAAQRPNLLLALSRHLLDANRLLEASDIVRQALEADPLRESAWRMRMRIMHEFHDQDGLYQTLKSCSAALAEIGVGPSTATRDLFARLSHQ
jgi:ATP/maltotriose-dependent transcriptional regulator MalT/DNA-binding SARP family transcriptional activator